MFDKIMIFHYNIVFECNKTSFSKTILFDWFAFSLIRQKMSTREPEKTLQGRVNSIKMNNDGPLGQTSIYRCQETNSWKFYRPTHLFRIERVLYVQANRMHPTRDQIFSPIRQKTFLRGSFSPGALKKPPSTSEKRMCDFRLKGQVH